MNRLYEVMGKTKNSIYELLVDLKNWLTMFDIPIKVKTRLQNSKMIGQHLLENESLCKSKKSFSSNKAGKMFNFIKMDSRKLYD